MFDFFKKTDPTKLDNSITFGFNTNTDEPYVKINIIDTDLKQAEYFGRLLKDITLGSYKHDIVKIMLDMSKKDLSINMFMQKSLAVWVSSLDLQSKQTNEPIILPSQFSKYSK